MKAARFLLGMALVATGLAACSGDGVGGYGGEPASSTTVGTTARVDIEPDEPTA
ncbi:hypothetical protein [Flaviflexus salsibiostraticola]|uniref:hypothetical protein n=1 Tax=Flaviflexus salsibiostraticola TaxID=1282737 RepID=UPI0013DDF5ED|nr:hypothetical protein [Flaviflexus salsibiostraticola]